MCRGASHMGAYLHVHHPPEAQGVLELLHNLTHNLYQMGIIMIYNYSQFQCVGVAAQWPLILGGCPPENLVHEDPSPFIFQP
jgi:hypothetical protein